MKKNIICVSVLALVSTVAFCAPRQSDLRKVDCKSSHGDKVTLTPVSDEALVKYPFLQKAGGVFIVTVDEALSSGYIGAIGGDGADDRWVSFDSEKTTATNDVVADWDGNSGVEVSLPHGFIANAARFQGQEFDASVHVIYDDIATDDVTNALVCKIVD